MNSNEMWPVRLSVACRCYACYVAAFASCCYLKLLPHLLPLSASAVSSPAQASLRRRGKAHQAGQSCLRRSALSRRIAMCRRRCSTLIVITMPIHLLLFRCARSSAYMHQSSFARGSTSFRIVVPTAAAESAHACKGRSLSSWSTIRRSAPVMMPEGPEVRTLLDQLQPAVGMRLTDLRFLSGRYVRHGRPRGFDDFRKTMTCRRPAVCSS